MNSGGRLSDQHCSRVLVLCSGNSHVHELRPGRFKDGSCLLNFHFGRQATIVSVLIKLQSLPELSDSILKQLLFGIQGSGCEVINCQIGVHGQIHHR